MIFLSGLDSPQSDRLHGLPKGNGTLQNYLRVDSNSIPLIRKPPNLSFVQAAALPLAYLTAYTALVQYGKLPYDPVEQDKGKRTVLVLGGSSGTGSIAVQMAKKMGCRVVATCSGKNVELVKKLGADHVRVTLSSKKEISII